MYSIRCTIAWGVTGLMPGLYEEACLLLERLCPNPRPQPLLEAGFSLAALARMDPLVLAELAGTPPSKAAEVQSRLQELLTLPKKARCFICGSKAKTMYERWVFEVEGGRGVARLEGLAPVCGDCARALEPLGFLLAGDRGEYKWLVKYLSKVNKVKKGMVEQAISMLEAAWRRTKFLSSWSVDASVLSRYIEDYMVLQHALQSLAEGRIHVKGETLVIPNSSPSSLVMVAAEILEELCSGTLNTASVAVKASSRGLRVNRLVLEEYVDAILSGGLCSRRRVNPEVLLEGAWVLSLPAEARAKLVASLVAEPGISETWITRVETPLPHVDPAPVYFYSTPSVEPEYMARAADDIARFLERAHAQGIPELRFYPRDPSTGRLSKRHLYAYRLA